MDSTERGMNPVKMTIIKSSEKQNTGQAGNHSSDILFPCSLCYQLNNRGLVDNKGTIQYNTKPKLEL